MSVSNPLRLAALLLLLLPACAPSAVPQPAPTPQILQIEITTTMQPLRPLLDICIQTQPEAGLVVLERAAAALAYENVTLRWGAHGLEDRIASGELQAFQLGEEELVIAAHPQNPLDSLPVDSLRALYHGDPVENGLQPWIYPEGEDSALVFSFVILSGEPAGTASAWLAPDPAAMRESIAANPQAVGALPRRWLDESVKPLAVEGLEPAALRQPILAVQSRPVTQAEETLLLCLQEHLARQ